MRPWCAQRPESRDVCASMRFCALMTRGALLGNILQESYVSKIVSPLWLAQPMAMSLAVVRSWESRQCPSWGRPVGVGGPCCMVCLMPQSQVSGSLENPHFKMFTLDRPTCVRNRLSAFQVVQGFSVPAGRCSSALMSRCTLASRGSSRSLHSSKRAAFAVVLMGFKCMS